MDIWVRISTHADNFDNPDKPDYSEIQDVIRNEVNYLILDFYLDKDIVVEPAIQD